MTAPNDAIADIIAAIGEPHFAGVVAGALAQVARFDLAALIAHPRRGPARVLFDNFAEVGCRRGIENYARTTRRINPILLSGTSGAIRARDFARIGQWQGDAVRKYLIESEDEEMGFRTLGWPVRQEEIGLYFDGLGGTIEIGLYRDRARASASHRTMTLLAMLSRPITASFERHAALAKSGGPAGTWQSRLSERERDVGDLLLAGCSSEAIALRLSISRHTVKDHRKNIFRKLTISSLAEFFALTRDRNA